MRILVTGGSGFLGRYLVTALQDRGHEPVAVTPPRGGAGLQCELTDARATLRLLEDVRPDAVVHLAARAKPGRIDTIQDLIANNIQSTVNVLDGVYRASAGARVILASSSAVYGAVPRERNPVSEDEPLRPTLPYGASKAASEAVASVYAAHGIDVVVVRAFNLVGPNQSARFALASFARQISLIAAGTGERVLETGPLNAVRDFIDVRDAARAYVLLLDAEQPVGPFNLCSGVPRLLRDVLNDLKDLAGVRATVRERPEHGSGGPADVPYQCGNGTALLQATGWRAEISWQQTLQDVLEDAYARGLEA